MGEDTEYGREDGYAAGVRDHPMDDTNGGEVSRDSEYAIAYREGYDVGAKDKKEEDK